MTNPEFKVLIYQSLRMIDLDTKYISEGLIENNKTIYFTVTNEGYMDYTQNMLKSLNKLNIDKKILIICLDKTSNDYFSSNKYFTYFINLNLNKLSEFGTEGFSKVTYIKLFLINQFLLMNYNVLLTDGDIVYIKNPIDYINLLKEEEGDMWIQNDSMEDGNYQNLCSGFLYIRSNEATKKYFNIDIPEFVERYNLCSKYAADQTYINLFVARYLNTHLFPLNKFPNGQYFYNFSDKITDSIIMVHFNWVVGHEKKEKMQQYNMWLV